jgi:hypothetical protein
VSAEELPLPANDVFIECDLLTLDTVVGVVDDVIPSNCPAGHSPGMTRELALEGRLGVAHHSLSNEIHTAI